MKIAAYGLFSAIMMILASNAIAGITDASAVGGEIGLASGVTDIAPQFLQGGALAVLGWTVWYMMTRMFPAHTEALKEQRDAFLAALKEEREFRKALEEIILNRLNK